MKVNEKQKNDWKNTRIWSFAQVCGTPHPQNPRIYSDTEIASARLGSTAFCVEKYYSLFK